ncbi:unnamed protein product [Ceutorhynchus assimilis]|uniref:MYND-type domain-containing protein n=1 Tax=Ceutorhynchus assimilis TaxID=467358 RepID=A0A9N9QM30_9CUCU|nr:unnamed protein product [Ceutorhynchus assimilis]
MESVLMPNEIDLFVDSMVPQNMKNLGTEQWLDWHNRLQKLNQEAAVEAACLKEEHVKETLVSFGKAKILVHEAILINIWKYTVLPKLLKLEPNPESTFIAYSILYHEGVCVSLLELVMYHSSCCEALEDSAIDLLDYVSGVISQLLNVKQEETPKHHENAQEELFRQRKNLSFEIGIKGLGILRYLAENMERLPVSVCSRLYGTHDVPVLLTEILMSKPWLNNGKQYVAGKWKDWDYEQLGQAEAQVWLTLRYILLDPECMKYYPITESRRNQLTRLLPLMSPTLLDQLSPMFELKHWLCKVSCLQEYSAPPKPLLLEAILDIKECIMQECGGKWKEIARKQVGNIFTKNKESLKDAAMKLTDAYNTDLLEQFEVKDSQMCAQCGKSAIQRCSKCKQSWYCSRSCQVNHWPQHKEDCIV